MNLLNNKTIALGVKKEKINNEIFISNDSDMDGKLLFLKKIYDKEDSEYRLNFTVKEIKGKTPELKIINLKRKVVLSFDVNTNNYFKKPASFFLIAIKVYKNSNFTITDCSLEKVKEKNYIAKNFNNDILLISPGYPSISNKYLFGFVHTRVREYQKNGMNLDIASVSYDSSFTTYTYEGVKVNKISFFELRNLLQVKKYKKILIHFFNEKITQIMDATDISQTELYLFFHGTDAVYRDYNTLCNPYFTPIEEDTNYQRYTYEERDLDIKRYNEMPNVKMIFGTNWLKDRSERQNNIKYNRYEIIPTYINESIFKYEDKNSELRKKICIIRKFDNFSTYSIDVNVRCILELSRRECFKDLEFDIYGEGYYHDLLLKPLERFENVHIHNRFLSHEEISKVHSEHGIALFATRYETMGVSAAEAALSGLAVITNKVAAVNEVFENSPLLCDAEDYVQMADKVEEMYNNPQLFDKYRKQQHDMIEKKYTYHKTLEKEIKMLNQGMPMPKYEFKNIAEKPVLTIAVASYNVEKYLKNSIQYLIKAKNASKLEILIINDGSKDNTAKIAKELENMTKVGNKSIVKFIDKENGGHGSAINKGIELATGKYFKLMDGDDYFDTNRLDELIEILEKEDSDIVLNNYVEDKSVECIKNPVRHYTFMKEGQKYNIEDLCYEGYGFGEWGPLLSTSTFRTDMIKKANFKISEKCFYVDMELNSFAFVAAKTIVYYPLDLYIYYLGRTGQSVSAASFKKNYKNHEHVTLRIIKEIYYGKEMSDVKREYLKDKIVIPLASGQYYIVTEYFNNKKRFMEFDKQLKEYPEFYNNEKVINKKLKKYRILNGNLFWFIKKIVKIKSIFRRIIKHN